MKKTTKYLIALAMSLVLAAGIYWYAKKKNLTLKTLLGALSSTGNSPVVLQDYDVNGAEVTLAFSNGTVGSITVEFRQGSTVVLTQKVPYAESITLTTMAFGYLDVWVDNTDLGTIYVPFQLTGEWTVLKSKCVDETALMNLQFERVNGTFIVTDSADNSAWGNVEYWHGADFLGNSIPIGHEIEPMKDHHITKKRWGNFPWFGSDNDGLQREMAQLTFKIVPKP